MHRPSHLQPPASKMLIAFLVSAFKIVYTLINCRFNLASSCSYLVCFVFLWLVDLWCSRWLLHILKFGNFQWKFPKVTWMHRFYYSPNGRFLVQETFPKTLPRFVLILISLQRWQHRVRNETKHFVSPHLIGPQFLANQHETNQHESAALIGLFHATSLMLPSVESYRNYWKPTQRGVQGYLSSLQWRVRFYKQKYLEKLKNKKLHSRIIFCKTVPEKNIINFFHNIFIFYIQADIYIFRPVSAVAAADASVSICWANSGSFVMKAFIASSNCREASEPSSCLKISSNIASGPGKPGKPGKA